MTRHQRPFLASADRVEFSCRHSAFHNAALPQGSVAQRAVVAPLLGEEGESLVFVVLAVLPVQIPMQIIVLPIEVLVLGAMLSPEMLVLATVLLVRCVRMRAVPRPVFGV